MEMERYCGTHDALDDAKRSKAKCKQLDNQWDDSKKLVEEQNIDPDYQRILRFILGSAEMYERPKRERENVIFSDEMDDSDGENDPQYKLFLDCLKEHGKSYVFDGENTGVPTFIKYEAESGSEYEVEHESQREMMTPVEQIDGPSNQKPGLLNDWTAVNQHESDMQGQSGKKISTQSSRKLMNLVEREYVSRREINLSYQKPGYRTNGLVQNQHSYDALAISSRKSNVEDCRLLRTTADRGTPIRVDNGLLCQKLGTRINWVTENQHEQCDHARLVKKDKVQSQLEFGKMVNGDHGADIEAVVQIDNGYLYQKPGQRNSWATKNQHELVDQAQPGEKNKVQNQRKLREVVEGTYVFKGHHKACKQAVVQIDNEHLNCQPGPKNNMLIENQCEDVSRARIGEKDEVQNQRNLWKVVKGTNLVKEGHEPNKIAAVQINNTYLCGKPGSRNKRVTENPCEHADQARPDEKDKVRTLINLQQLDKGKNVVRIDHKGNGKGVAQIDNQHLYKKPGQGNNWVTQHQNEPVDLSRPVKKYKVHTHRNFKGKNIVKGDDEANKKAIVLINNENTHQKPGPRNNWVTRNNCERVDQARPIKKDEIKDQWELVKVVERGKVVQGDNGLSSQKSAFGSYAAKNQLDLNVEARSGAKGIHSKSRDAKAAKCLVVYENSDGYNQEKEGDDEIDSDVEILDAAACLKKGILSSFVPSKKFHKSMEGDDFQLLGIPSVCDEFRKRVLDVLSKPFDKEEYIRHREAVQVGSYLNYHPDLGRKLKKYRYKRGKCLNILRGFFFWLQNLTQEGAFQPWNDRQCLAVEPGSPKNSHPTYSRVSGS